ncbi:MAG TPA: hypothetical protein VI932_12135 [Bacteroidota bacterium]|nr:hypothetical protein [Bacteroidota bacterium]
MNPKSLLLVVMLGCWTPGMLPAQTGWVKKVAGSGLGNPFCVNPLNDNVLYGAVGTNKLYISRDRGNSWQVLSTIASGGTIKSVAVSARDTNLILVAQEAGPPDRIVKSTDHGVSWRLTLQKDFYYWGVPLAYAPELGDDTVYTMGSNTIFRSTDFGDTWDSVCYNPFSSANQGWEYAVIRPDSPNVIIAADNMTGIWKSDDYGAVWRRKHSTTGEIPALAITRGNPSVLYAARWAGGGGFLKSTDGGESWFYSTPLDQVNMWGVDVSKDDQDYLIAGTFGPMVDLTGGIYLSNDAGSTWRRTYEGLTGHLNFACLALDSLNVFVLQNDGIYKLGYPFSLTVVSPDGGEVWYTDSTYSVTWTSQFVNRVGIDYTTDDGASWIPVADTLEAGTGSYPWTVPVTPSGACRIRIRDLGNPSLSDVSDSTFTIDDGSIRLIEPNGGERISAGSNRLVTWEALNIDRITLDFSTDSGVSWVDIATGVDASIGEYEWTVPHTPSPSCFLRAWKTTDPFRSDVSDSAFVITDSLEFTCFLRITDNGGEGDTLGFSELAGASDGIDPGFGEAELPPKPGPGIFDARWELEGTNGSRADVRDTTGTMRPRQSFFLALQPGPGGYPMMLRWDPGELPAGRFFLTAAGAGGETTMTDMKTDSVLTLVDTTVSGLEIRHTFIATVLIQVVDRWNLMALPLEPDDAACASVYPTAASDAYAFNDGYTVEDTLLRGRGYWMKFTGEKYVGVTGIPVLGDTIGVTPGWNLIGGLWYPIPVSAVTTVPAGIVVSSFYGFQGGYYRLESLEPGRGFWIKSNAAGVMILPPPESTKTKR